MQSWIDVIWWNKWRKYYWYINISETEISGQSVSLDALCRKYNIDLRDRQIHGALKDAKLLATVYLELIGKQSKLEFENTDEN